MLKGSCLCIKETLNYRLVIYITKSDFKNIGAKLSQQIQETNCPGAYAVNGYIRSDGVKVDGYIRSCGVHSN